MYAMPVGVAFRIGKWLAVRNFSDSSGVYQIGDVYAPSWVVVGISGDRLSP